MKNYVILEFNNVDPNVVWPDFINPFYKNTEYRKYKNNKIMNDANIKDKDKYIHTSESASFIVKTFSEVKKYIPVINEKLTFNSAKIIDNYTQFCEMKNYIDQASKIIIFGHGAIDNRDRIYMKNEKGGIAMFADINIVAEMLSKFLTSGKNYKIGLFTCYGARSFDHEKNHETNLSSEDLTSSSAYKFIRTACLTSGARISLSARYGEAGTILDRPSIHYHYTMNEATSLAKARFKRLSAAFDLTSLEKEYDELSIELSLFNVEEIIDTLKKRNEDQKTIDRLKTYSEMQRLRTESKLADTRYKYGKFMYISDDAKKIRIYRKYDDLESEEKRVTQSRGLKPDEKEKSWKLLYEGSF